jgi:hypothetical protein
LSECGSSDSYRIGFVSGNSVSVFGDHAVSGSATTATQVIPEYSVSAKTWSSWSLPGVGAPTVLPSRSADDGRRIFFLQNPSSCSGTPSVLIYDNTTMSWSTDSSVGPVGFVAGAAVAWSGSELIGWSGSCGVSLPVSVGGRYQPPAP